MVAGNPERAGEIGGITPLELTPAASTTTATHHTTTDDALGVCTGMRRWPLRTIRPRPPQLSSMPEQDKDIGVKAPQVPDLAISYKLKIACADRRQ